jgi:hypothetical protein
MKTKETIRTLGFPPKNHALDDPTPLQPPTEDFNNSHVVYVERFLASFRGHDYESRFSNETGEHILGTVLFGRERGC